jgi:thiol-disulfide isomerase/thioredoxin
MFRTLEGVHAPELIWSSEKDWINTEPLQLSGLRGTVVLIDFWDYTCINCINTLPYVRTWHDRYSGLDLVIIGIHTPEFEFASSRENVEEAVRRFEIKYPVLLDNSYLNWQAFANRYWPRKYLIDPNGYVVYDQAGEGAYGETESMIQQQIRRIHPEAQLPDLMRPIREMDRPGAVCYPTTPELYAGYKRGELGNPVGYQPDRVIEFLDPKSYRDGFIYAHGPWFNGADFMRHARKTDRPDDYVAIRYHAKEVNAVIRPSNGKAFDVVVTQDDKPLAEIDMGDDIRQVNGKSILHVDAPRMYRIVNNNDYGSHVLKLASTSDAFEIYAFTFGSCEEAKSSR